MDSSSDDDAGFVRRKTSSKKILDSDDENDDIGEERTEDFKLHLSDDDDIDSESIGAKIAISLADEPSEGSVELSNNVSLKIVETASEKSPLSDNSVPEDDLSSQSSNNQKVRKTTCFQGTEAIMKKLSALADSDSDSDEEFASSQQKNKINSTACTRQSDSDDEGTTELNEGSHDSRAQSLQIKTEKCGPARKSKTKAKDAMLEIKAESQRQLRQSKIGLPYHIPKQRSLMDFLNRRKSSSPMPIKGPVDQLASVWKQIEEREKEVELFYKSESESESDADDNSVSTPSTEQVDDKSDAATSNKHVEAPGNQVNGILSTGKEQPADDLALTEKEPSSLSLDTNQTLKSFSEDCGSKLVTSSVHNCNLAAESDNIITESKPEILPETEKIPAAEPNKIESAKENSSTAIEQVGASSDSHETPVKENWNLVTLDVGKDNDKSKVQGNDEEKSIVHNQDSGSVSIFPSETQNHSETVNIIKENKTSNSLKDSEDGECNIGKDKEPAKISSQITSTEDSQEIRLHFSETQSHIDEDNTTFEDNKASELNAAKGRTLTWDELDAAIRNDEHSASEDISHKRIIHNKQLISTRPCLSLHGDPNDIIDLDDMKSKPSAGVKRLIERFMKHSASKKKSTVARTVELSVISSDKNNVGDVTDIKQESILLHVDDDDDYRSEINITPGARLKLLKNELNQQMRKLKEEEWQKKLEEMLSEKYYAGEKDECGGLPDEDEEEEMTDSEAESEPEINDVREPRKKKRTKSMFVDEEAEVEDENDGSGLEEKQEDGVDSDDEDEDDCDVHDTENSGEESDEENNSEEDKSVSDPVQNIKLKNVSVDLSNELVIHKDLEKASGSLQRTMTSVSDLFASQSNEWQNPTDEDDDFIPPGQPNGVVRSDLLTQKPDEQKNSSMYLSPCLTNPGKKLSFVENNHEMTPLKCSWPMEPASPSIKRLFSEAEPESTQEKLAELAGLFGDKFKDSQEGMPAQTITSSNLEPETDLMALCSGKFVTQVPEPKDLEEGCTQPFESLGSQFSSQMSKADESYLVPNDADDSVDFSLKWDGDAKSHEDAKSNEDNEDSCNLQTKEKFRLEVASSDEEEDTLQNSKKKKRKQKLQFSDDEDAQEENDLESLGSDLSEINDKDDASNDGKAKLFGVFNKPSKEVFYDSDENEIEASDFLEKEAELSEEEDWHGSEDEDEKGLDQLEMDEADKEDIDQDQVREQLVKNHMQKMLDEDRRDVRILQEMLLEDGELHSDTGGRERQFRWKNVDSSGMGDDKQLSDDEHANQDEDEDDAEWRKQRHEREMFLREQREKQKNDVSNLEEEDEVLENSELLQLGKSVLFKSRSSSLDMSSEKDQQPLKPLAPNLLLSPDGKQHNVYLSKRGSFLSRGDNVLAKLAKITGSAKGNVLAGAKSSGNFVFSSKSPPKKESQSQEDFDTTSSKRKAVVSLLNPTEKKQCVVVPKTKRTGLFDHL